MDNLARDMIACRKAGFGVSYGKWKATQPPKEEKPKTIESGWRVCEYCGKPYKPKTRRPQKYCEIYCQQMASYDREKTAERVRKHRKARKDDGIEAENARNDEAVHT